MKHATLQLVLRNYNRKESDYRTICLRYIAYRRCTHISLKIKILPKDWIASTQRIRSTVTRSIAINREIQAYYDKGRSLIDKYFEEPLSTKEFTSKYKEQFVNPVDFYFFAKNEIEIMQGSVAEGTILNYTKFVNTLKEWKKELPFEEISFTFIELFHTYELKKGNLQSTVYKKHAIFKALLNKAIRKGIIDNNPYKHFKIKKNIKAQNNHVLTEGELHLLQLQYDKNIYKGEKQITLRCFLFSCYTGLSFVDFSTIKYKHLRSIIINEDKHFLIVNNRIKTNAPYRLPIVSPVVKQILGNGSPEQKIFPKMYNHRVNAYLKIIMADLKIEKEISFHRARHTFLSIAARKWINSDIAERIMGHSEGNSVKDIYIHLDDQDIVKEMLSKWVV